MKYTGKRVSIHWVKAILAAAESLGIMPNKILAELRLNLDLEHNQPGFLSLEQTQAIWQKAEALSANPYFGLHMGTRVRPSYFNAVSYVAMTSDTLLAAYGNFTRFLPLISEGAVMDMVHEGQSVWVRFVPRPDETPFSRHQVESVVALILTFSRWLVGEEIRPSAVHFSHNPGPDMAEYRAVFGVEPQFNQEFSGIQIPRPFLSRVPIEADPGLNALHKSHAEQLLAAHQNTSWEAKVIQIIIESGHFALSREQVAERLNISTRTLQRRLQEEHTSFLEVMDAQRKQKAEALIYRTKKSLKEIALDLGFAEPSTFYRACHRWFDQTPNAMRAAHGESENL